MSGSNRRDFLKTMGKGALAAGIFMNLPEASWVYAGEKDRRGGESLREERAQCDVLVVGGGIAACFAAIKAREQGAEVILVDKGFSGRSGQSPFAKGTLVFNPGWGDSMEAWLDYISRVSEYLNNREWNEITFRESWARYRDMVSWGVQFRKGEDGRPERTSQPGVIPKEVMFEGGRGDFARVLRRQVLKSGARIIDRIMVAELMKQNGRVVGAIGFSPDDQRLQTITAQTTIMCVGACSYKPAGYPPITQLTGDGEAMAYRAGAEILGKEFIDTHPTRMDIPVGTPNMLELKKDLPEEFEGLLGGRQGSHRIDAEGNRLPDRPDTASQYRMSYLQFEFEAHAGRAPIYGVTDTGSNELTGGACLGMSIRKADGIWPADKNCASSVPGLYAAGDALGTSENGAVYAINGSSSMGSAVTGAIAGAAAAGEALQMTRPGVDETEIDRARQFVLAPGKRKGGYSPRWVTQLLQNTMAPYFVYFIKKADRLEGALTQVMFMQEHLVPRLIARDPHELRLAHETRNMVLSAEMRLRSALFRTESRGNHYREDFPGRDDKNWLAWTKIRQEAGKMTLVKEPMPEAWRPDQSLPYEQRYPYRYPGEKI